MGRWYRHSWPIMLCAGKKTTTVQSFDLNQPIVAQKNQETIRLLVVYLGGGNSNILGIFTLKIGEMVQFDLRIFLKWAGSTTTWCIVFGFEHFLESR